MLLEPSSVKIALGGQSSPYQLYGMSVNALWSTTSFLEDDEEEEEVFAGEIFLAEAAAFGLAARSGVLLLPRAGDLEGVAAFAATRSGVLLRPLAGDLEGVAFEALGALAGVAPRRGPETARSSERRALPLGVAALILSISSAFLPIFVRPRRVHSSCCFEIKEKEGMGAGGEGVKMC
jgi:hypothetical protein